MDDIVAGVNAHGSIAQVTSESIKLSVKDVSKLSIREINIESIQILYLTLKT
jgi:hypothetical protein